MRVLAACLCAFGLALVSCADDGSSDTAPTTLAESPAADEPDPPETTTLLDAGRDFEAAWQQVAVDEPWVDSIGDVAALPDSGFVAVLSDTSGRSNVLWSPDGVEWIDGDPEQRLPTVPSWSEWYEVPQYVAATAHEVVVLDQANIGVWIGEPETGRWELISLDTTGLDADVKLRAVAANDTEVLVLATNEWTAIINEEGEDVPIVLAQLVVWHMDSSEAPPPTPVVLPATIQDLHLPTPVEWFDGQWIMMAPTGTDEWLNSVWMSPDGTSWAEDTPKDFEHPWVSISAGPPSSLTAGTSGVIGSSPGMGGDSLWHSLDGLTWNRVELRIQGDMVRPSNVSPPVYSDTLGYVVVFGEYWGEGVWMSSNGTDWELAGAAPPGGTVLAASDHTLLGFDHDAETLWLWSPDPD